MCRGFCHLEMSRRDCFVSKAISGFFATSAAFLSALGGKKILTAEVAEKIRNE